MAKVGKNSWKVVSPQKTHQKSQTTIGAKRESLTSYNLTKGTKTESPTKGKPIKTNGNRENSLKKLFSKHVDASSQKTHQPKNQQETTTKSIETPTPQKVLINDAFIEKLTDDMMNKYCKNNNHKATKNAFRQVVVDALQEYQNIRSEQSIENLLKERDWSFQHFANSYKNHV